ncbi:MAG: hypothetical protein U0R81_01780 [Mycobacterium sp.]
MIFDDRRDFTDVYPGAAEDVRHVLVHLDQHTLGATRGRQCEIVVGSKGEISVGVHRGNRHHERVEFDVFFEDPRNLTEMSRHEVQRPDARRCLTGQQMPISVGDEKAVSLDVFDDVVGEQRRGQLRHGQLVIEPDPGEISRTNSVRGRCQQRGRLGDRRAAAQRLPLGDGGHRQFWGGELRGIHLRGRKHACTPSQSDQTMTEAAFKHDRTGKMAV